MTHGKQTSFTFPPTIRINGDQLFETAETNRKLAAELLRSAAIFEQMAIEAWAKAEGPQRLAVDPYLQTR